jgi:hypothetical protein
LKIDRVTGTNPSCFRTEAKDNKKGSGDRRKIRTPSPSPKPERDLNKE